jgi:integrase
MLAETSMRPGELTHLLVEDIDPAAGLPHIRNKPALGWSIKTRNTPTIPLPAEPLAVLQRLVKRAGVDQPKEG